jgi:hypothetical protein
MAEKGLKAIDEVVLMPGEEFSLSNIAVIPGSCVRAVESVTHHNTFRTALESDSR